MSSKRRRSREEDPEILPASKKTRTRHPLDYLSDLSDELLIRILHNLPIQDLLQCQRLSHKFYTLAGDSQIWKNLYYDRFVLPRALRIPGIKTTSPEEALHFSSRRSKWLDEDTLVNRVDGKKTYWKGQYKLRHNWSIGACDVQEIHVADRPLTPDMLVKLAEGVVLTADREDGLRAWDLKGKELVAKCDFDGVDVPTCLAIDEQESQQGSLGIAVGFMDGGWGVWKLDVPNRIFAQNYKHPPSSNGTLSAVAFAYPYVLIITDAQLLSLYTFGKRPPPTPAKDDSVKSEIDLRGNLEVLEPEPEPELEREPKPKTETEAGIPSQLQETLNEPYLLASLKSHTSWPPLSLSIRTTPKTLIASIAYCLPTYLSGYTIGLQELHLSIATSSITFSRLTSAQPQGFHSILSLPPTPPSMNPSPSSSQPAISTRPTSLSYSHPYILATHPDNTLTLYLCTSTSNHLYISPGTKLWGHTSSVSSAEITPRGKAVSVSTRGNELRVWELEAATSSRKRSLRTGKGLLDRSVMIRPGGSESIDPLNGDEREIETRKNWVGFDDEMVIVLKESRSGTQALMVYDFT